MVKWLKSLIQKKNLMHVVLNLLIILATTITISTDTVTQMLLSRGFSAELAILWTSFVLLCAKEFILNYWKTPDAPITETPDVEV